MNASRTSLANRIIRDLEQQDPGPTVYGWKLGATADGLPLISGELAYSVFADPMVVLQRLGEAVKGRQLDVSDSDRLTVTFTWPEPQHGGEIPPAEAVVELWIPAVRIQAVAA